jgi:uncharacterized protein involved in copper resistance
MGDEEAPRVRVEYAMPLGSVLELQPSLACRLAEKEETAGSERAALGAGQV